MDHRLVGEICECGDAFCEGCEEAIQAEADAISAVFCPGCDRRMSDREAAEQAICNDCQGA